MPPRKSQPVNELKRPSKQINKEMSVKEFFDTVYPAQARWATMGVFAVLCIAVIAVSCVLYYREVKRELDYKSVEDQFHKLRRSIAEVRQHDEFHRATPPKTATEAGKLKTYIEEQKKLLEERKLEYKHLYTIGERTQRSWSPHGKSFYYYSLGKKTWYDAEKFCISRDSHLTSILSEDEQKLISSQIKQPVWIGLTDEKEKDTWKWTDSSRFTTQYWSKAKPSHPVYSLEIEQLCVSLSPSTKIYNWNRDDCYTLKKWVCKRTLDVQDE